MVTYGEEVHRVQGHPSERQTQASALFLPLIPSGKNTKPFYRLELMINQITSCPIMSGSRDAGLAGKGS